MKRSTLELIYAIIFLLSLLLYVFSMWKYIASTEQDWFTFSLALAIMFMSLWGYLIIKKYIK